MVQAVKVEDIHRCYLGLGGNLTNYLGTPSQHIAKALDALKAHNQVYHVRASSLYKSRPLGPQDQPDFINAVAEIDTTLKPQELLELCQKLEQDAKRVRLRRWGERSLDIDILLYANQKISSPTLTIPHPGIKERNFVLIPLHELNPNLKIDDELISNIPQCNDMSGLMKLA